MRARASSFPVSLLLALLRKKRAEFDAGGGDTWLILSREQVAALQREQQVQERELRRAIADSGGDRLERLALEVTRKEAEKQRRTEKAARYDLLRQALGLLPLHQAEDFLAQRALCAPLREDAALRAAALQNELNERGAALRKTARNLPS